MTELKTLKNICEECQYGCERILRQEAIKWVKAIQNRRNEKGFKFDSWFHQAGTSVSLDDYSKGMLQILKEFFNLTEEDIKNE